MLDLIFFHRFFYHMLGKDMGALNVYTQTYRGLQLIFTKGLYLRIFLQLHIITITNIR